MLDIIKRLVREEEGQGMVEYGLILALIAIAVIVTLGLVGNEIDTIFDKIKDALTDAQKSGGNG